MFNDPSCQRPPNEPAQGLPKSSFDTLADQFACSLRDLSDNVMGLDGAFKTVLRPEAACVTPATAASEPARSLLEEWLLEQFRIVRNCNARIAEYRERCCL